MENIEKEECIYGHDLVPVLGFDNVIIDYTCRACGILESEIEQQFEDQPNDDDKP